MRPFRPDGDAPNIGAWQLIVRGDEDRVPGAVSPDSVVELSVNHADVLRLLPGKALELAEALRAAAVRLAVRSPR